MTVLALTVAAACFFGDGNPLTGECLSLQFETDTVVECATGGDATVPLHINAGDRNPGPGVVLFGTTDPYTLALTIQMRTPFEARGYSGWRPTNAAVYIVPSLGDSITPPPDLIFAAGLEACVCHTRFPGQTCESL